MAMCFICANIAGSFASKMRLPVMEGSVTCQQTFHLGEPIDIGKPVGLLSGLG
jgi:hypothetical protein